MNRRGSEIEKKHFKKALLQKFQTLITSHMERNKAMRLEKRAFVAYHGGKIKETK